MSRRRKKTIQPEQRDNSAAWERGPCNGTADSLSGLAGILPGQSNAGVHVDSQSALTLSSMWNGVTLIASEIATLPVSVFQVTSRGKELRTEHHLSHLLDRECNPDVDAIAFTSSLLIDAIMHGDGFAEVVRSPDTLEPVALYNIPHGSVSLEVVKDPDDWVSGSRIVYRIDSQEGHKSYLLSEDVLHVKGPTQPNGLRGISLIDKALRSLGLGLASQTHACTFFANGSRADGFLKYNGTGNPKQIQDKRDDFYKTHGGIYNSNRVGYLTGDWSWVPTSVDPEKSQLLETRKHGDIEVCQWLNLAPINLQIYDKASLNYEQSMLDFGKRTLRPWVERLELELERKLLTREELDSGYAIRHDFSARLRGDSASVTNFAKELFPIGGINRDEIRDLFDYGKVDGGETFYMASNNLTPITPVVPVPAEAPQAPPGAIPAVRALILSEVGRLVRRETTALRKALGKPDREQRIADFYQGHGQVVRESLGPVLTAYATVSGRNFDIDTIVSSLTDGSRRELTTSDNQERLLDDWTTNKAERVINEAEEAR